MRIAAYEEEGSLHFAAKRSDGWRRIENVGTFADLARIWASGHTPQLCANAVTIADARLVPPVGYPVRHIFCVGWNYLKHFEEGRSRRSAAAPAKIPSTPTFFSKATTALVRPYSSILAHEQTTSLLDWEVELAVVIGRTGTNIPEASALDHVFGYCVANDVSARDLQKQHGGQWFKGKSLDRTCPLGPHLVTADEVPEPQQLELECRVNGVVKQHASTRQMAFPVRRIIAELSRGLTLLPGDIILTGTPEGIGAARVPQERLRPGDVLESEITGIGLMRNPIVAKPSAEGGT